MPNTPTPPVITHTWGIAQIECSPIEDGNINVVKTVHWTVIADDGSYTASSYGSVGLASPEPEAFIAYDELTRDTVVDWVKDALNANEIEAALASNIDEQRNPKIVRLPAPWDN